MYDERILGQGTTFFKRKCEVCKKRSVVAYFQTVAVSKNYDMNLYYCEECGTKHNNLVRKKKKLEMEELKQAQKERLDKETEEKRIAYLKKEIEKREIEAKAKELGIIYPETNKR